MLAQPASDPEPFFQGAPVHVPDVQATAAFGLRDPNGVGIVFGQDVDHDEGE